ncbi:hypothetical protein ACFL96_14910 [Thermoproteota archaeon]
MKKMQMAEFTVNMLDPKEEKDVESVILGEMYRRKASMERIAFPGGTRVHSGWDVFTSVPAAEDAMERMPVEQVPNLTNQWVSSLDTLILHEPDYFEYHYLAGRVLSVALDIIAPATVRGRMGGGDESQSDHFERYMNHFFPKAEEYLRTAILLFERFAQDKDEEVMLHGNRMELALASTLRSRAMYKLNATQDIEEEKEHVIEMAQESILTYLRILRTGFFENEAAAAGVLTNLANALKLVPTPDSVFRGLIYYNQAKKILGPIPQIVEGTRWFMLAASRYEKEE